MAITSNASSDGTEFTIKIDGRFDFGVQKDFRSCYEGVTAKKYIIDMGSTDYMDSSALGMLLMMREHAGGADANITLKNCTSDIKAILSVANFQSLFTIS